MKKLICSFVCLILLSSGAFAAENYYAKNKMPEGTFKKSHTGKIIQYDKNGKKIGVYKQQQGRYVRVK